MKLDLQENMYVRTKHGIKQIYKIDNNKTKWKYLYKLKKQDGDGCVDLGVLSNEDIIKASFNIVDILEVGDFLDNHCISKIENNTYYLNDGWFINVDDIENLVTSICTKEQFEQISYKLGE